MEGNYSGFQSNLWNADSRSIGESTNMLRSFVLQNIVQDNQWEIDRITKYYLYWKFYEGMHYKDFNDGLLSFNYVAAFTDKINMFLLGDSAFSFHVKSFYSNQVDKDIETVAEELMMFHWDKSQKVELAYEMLQMGGVTGDCWVGVEWMPSEEDRYCRIRVYDSRQCFPRFRNGDFNQVESFLVRQPLDDKQSKYCLFVKRWTKEKIETWYQKDVTIDNNNVAKYEYQEYPNRYGFIPVVHIKNRPNAAGYYGKSDMNNILKINKVYNEMMQEVKSVIDYYVTPTTVITGASAKSLKKGLGQIWSGLPPEANVFNLGLDVDLSATTNYIKDLKTAMHELSDVPENALGKIQAISNTSAAALQITYQPLMQQANLKGLTYGNGIARINSMILRVLQVEDPKNERLQQLKELSPNFLAEMRIEPVFAYGFPKDGMVELNKANMEMQLKISSRREIMERMGKSNIPDLLNEIDEDQKRIAKMQQAAMGMFGGDNNNEDNNKENFKFDFDNTNENENDNENEENS